MKTYDYYARHFMALHTVSRFLIGRKNLQHMRAAGVIAHALAYRTHR